MYTLLKKILFLTLCVNAQNILKFQTAFEWNYINFTYPSSSEFSTSAFEPGIYTMFGIDVHKPTNSIYLTLPRTHRKARVTLARLSLSADTKNPLLSPFPSWEMNRGTDCYKLQDVSNIEIDKEGIMWVLDAKRNNKEVTTCPARIVLLDLKNGGRFLGNFIIPEEFCSWKTNCLVNDIVLDGDFIYLTYINDNWPGIMILNKMTGKFWTLGGAHDSIEKVSGYGEVKKYFWIALSFPSKNRSLYIAPQAARFFYKIPTRVLQNEKLSSNGYSFIQKDVEKFVDTSSVMGDSEGDVYIGYPRNNSVYVRDAAAGHVHLVDKNPNIIINPGTFSFDNSGYLYMTSGFNDLFSNNTIVNRQEINFRILRVRTGSKSYQHPNLLKQTAGHRHLHVEDLIHEKEALRKHQDELRRHIEDQKKHLQEQQKKIKDMEKLQKDEEKKERDEEKNNLKKEQERRKDEERHQKEVENRHREEEKRREKEEQDRRKNEEKRLKDIENKRREGEKRRTKEEQERLKNEEKLRREEENRRKKEEQQRHRDEEKRRQEEEKDRKEELKRQQDEEKRKQREEEQRQKDEQKRLEEDNQRRLKHQHDHEILEEHTHHHESHGASQRPHYPYTEYSTRHQTVRRTRPQYSTTTEYTTTRHTVGATRPQYPTTTMKYPTIFHTVRRTRPTTQYPTSRSTVRKTRPQYPTTTAYSTSHHTVRRTRPTYTQTTEYLTTPTRKRTPPPHYTQSTVYSTSRHQGTKPHYP